MRMPTYACGCTNVLACPRLFNCVLTPQSPLWLPGQQAVIDNNWKIVHAPGTGQCTMQVGANVCEWIGGGSRTHVVADLNASQGRVLSIAPIIESPSNQTLRVS